MKTTITLQGKTKEFKTAREAKDYLFNLIDSNPRPNRELMREIEINLDRLLNVHNIQPQEINAAFIKAINI
jgi:hypothetical protein